MSEAPERIYLDGDVEAGDGMFPRCFENPKYASEPPVEYLRADHVADMLKAEREKALREALTACDKALSDMQAANPNRHDALPYIEDGCEACKDAIEALISEDKTDG